ncbi:hypothetical protein QBC46DRAFT_316985 [Diplogelasinospora grovesii]|uniref:DUF7025 domain-containing protein n=1 Tax=Diplogelasinospora grovesii TaxID=303347 RepID=A0AAN6S2N1_9PEZI|nr:hypothetical protein QBC46DRAFT_316985 [Diplogelasinospora grovesii]
MNDPELLTRRRLGIDGLVDRRKGKPRRGLFGLISGHEELSRSDIRSYTGQAIRVLERELKSLKEEEEAIQELQSDREQLQSLQRLQRRWESERSELLQKQAELERLSRAEQPSVTDEAKSRATKLPEPEPEPAPEPKAVKEPPAPVYAKAELNYVGWEDFRQCSTSFLDSGDAFAIDVLEGEPIGGNPGSTPHVPGQKPLPERIRINSKHIVKLLSRIDSENIMSSTYSLAQSLVMIRPYKALDYFDDPIRQKLQELEAKFGGRITSTPSDAAEAPASAEPPKDKKDAKEERNEFTYSITAYQHLKCLVQFMDTQIREKIAYLRSDRCKTVAFTEIWYLFRPGDEVIEQTLRQAYRVISVSSPNHQVVPPWRTNWSEKEKLQEEMPVVLQCVYIDFDGKQLGPVLRKVRFPRYDGEREVTSLEIFPLRFAGKKDAGKPEKTDAPGETFRDRLIARGKMFVDMTSFKHMHYGGLTLDTRDEVDSNVVVDFEEAFSQYQAKKVQQDPSSAELEWRPTLKSLIGLALEEERKPLKPLSSLNPLNSLKPLSS